MLWLVRGFNFVCMFVDVFAILKTINRCKTLKRLATNPLVLSKAGAKTFAMKAERWSDSAHQFLKQCVKAGNREAAYTLGMVSIYLLSLFERRPILFSKD